MTNSKHTPGPWNIRAERYRFIHVYASGGGIAHLDTIDGEGAANARLIAAAPALLEAALMVDALSIQSDAHKALRTAIAMATRNGTRPGKEG